MEIRDKIANNLQYKVGDGKSISMWLDKWHDNGLLINSITHRDLYDARLSKKITLYEMIEGGVWKWPLEWRNSDFDVMNIQAPLLIEGVQDKVMWKKENNSMMPFHVKHVMDCICPIMEEVRWTEIVWFKQCIPKHSFCLWLAMLGRLLTQDRIMSWGTQTGLLCPLCNNVNDSHSHLFCLCNFSNEIGRMIKGVLQIR